MRIGLLAVLVWSFAALGEEPKLAPNAPKDHPVEIKDSRNLDAAIAPLIAGAKKTWPAAKKRFLAGLPRGEVFSVTVRLYEGAEFEQCFVIVKQIKNALITGTVANEMMGLKKVKEGDTVTVKEAEIVDWTISKPDGSEEGNVVGKYLDAHGP